MRLCVILLLLVKSSAAFLALSSRVSPGKTVLNLSAQGDEISALRAAAARAREDADRLARELGKPAVSATTTATATKKVPKEELESRLQGVAFDSSDMEAQSKQLERLRDEGSLTLFKSANLRTYPVSLQLLESRTQISLESFGFGSASGEKVSLDDFKYSTLFVLGGSSIAGVLSLAFLPPNVGSTLCYLFALVPVLYLGIGSTAPGAIAQLIDGVKNKDNPDRGTETDRVARHEAAHFMCGYMCGLLVADYKLLDGGIPCVEFSVGGRQRFSKEAVAGLSITAMSGLVVEAMQFGNVQGAEQDLTELELVFRRAEDFIGAQQQQDLTRWGALQAFLMLKENQGKLDEIVEAFKAQKSVAECVAILES